MRTQGSVLSKLGLFGFRLERFSLERSITMSIAGKLEKTPGLKARYKRTRKQSLEGVMPPMRAGAGVTLAPRNAKEIKLMQQPDVLTQIQQIQRCHYETWPEIPLPALNGRTPLEAVKESDGREMVDALITQFERDATRMPVPVDATIFAALRRRFGLSPTLRS